MSGTNANDNRDPGRSMRIPDVEWDAAMAVATERGDSLTQVVRYYLGRYTANPPKRRFPAPRGAR